MSAVARTGLGLRVARFARGSARGSRGWSVAVAEEAGRRSAAAAAEEEADMMVLKPGEAVSAWDHSAAAEGSSSGPLRQPAPVVEDRRSSSCGREGTVEVVGSSSGPELRPQ